MEKMDNVKKSNRQALQPMKQMDDMESVQMDNMESVQMDDMPIARLLDNLWMDSPKIICNNFISKYVCSQNYWLTPFTA